MKPREVDYWVDIHDENAKVSDSLKSFGNKKEQMKIMEGWSLFYFFILKIKTLFLKISFQVLKAFQFSTPMK